MDYTNIDVEKVDVTWGSVEWIEYCQVKENSQKDSQKSYEKEKP